MENSFTTEIMFSSFEMNARDRIKFKDITDAIRIDERTQSGEFTANICNYAILKIHNAKSHDNPDYENIVYIADDGTKYVSGSKSLFNAFVNIWDELRADGDTEPVELKFYRVPSKNYNGKDFLSCSLIG